MNGEKAPKIIFGTMTFGDQVDEKTADQMVGLFLEKGYVELDTAHNYTDGRSEEFLGRILAPSRRGNVHLATKMNPGKGGGLGPERLAKQLDLSLKRLQTDYVDLLYLHAPDSQTPIEATLDCCGKLFGQGKFREFGLSNYAAWQVIDIRHACKKNGWPVPVVYQGMYNAITRDVEQELFPALRKVGMKFYAYNPLAGGLLTGKYSDPDARPSAGRFALKPTYGDRYWKEGHFRAVQVIRRACEKKGTAMAESAFRWIRHHSLLQGANGDGMILGATSLEQLEKNLKGCEGGTAPAEVIAAFDQAWEIARPHCQRYFRS